MTSLWFVRHGPTHQKALTGWRDVPADLSDTAQIGRINAHLPQNALLISSDLSRAIDTADAIGDGKTRLPHSPQLREFDFGSWDGKKFDEIAESDPSLSRQFWEQPGHICPPFGESWYDVAYRVGTETDHLIDRFPGRDLIIVAHFGAILTQVARARACTPYQAFAQPIDNLSISHVRIENGNWSAGDVNFLP